MCQPFSRDNGTADSQTETSRDIQADCMSSKAISGIVNLPCTNACWCMDALVSPCLSGSPLERRIALYPRDESAISSVREGSPRANEPTCTKCPPMQDLKIVLGVNIVVCMTRQMWTLAMFQTACSKPSSSLLSDKGTRSPFLLVTTALSATLLSHLFAASRAISETLGRQGLGP